MAVVLSINPKADPAYIPAAGGSGIGFLPAIIVATVAALNAVVAGSVPLVCLAFIRDVGVIQLTEDAGATWNAYS